MTLNPQVSTLLAMLAQMPPVDYATITPDEMRALHGPVPPESPPQVGEVRDLLIALPGRTLTARFYVPEEADENPPLVMFYHGGGWVLCSIETHDGLARALARASGAAVLSVDYRLAPETPFPGPLDDCYEALVWAASHADELGIDASRIAVSGDSAGGNLAAAVALRARDENGPLLRHQLLMYPVTAPDFGNASYTAYGGGDYFLSTAAMQWFWTQYVGDHTDPAPHAAVLRHENLAGLPPATVIVAQCDPLRDEGIAYADALKAAGVTVNVEEAPGMIHGFLSMFEAVPDAMPFIDRAGDYLMSRPRTASSNGGTAHVEGHE